MGIHILEKKVPAYWQKRKECRKGYKSRCVTPKCSGMTPNAKVQSQKWSWRGKDKKTKDMSSILHRFVTVTSVPFVTYIPQPRTVLHYIDPRLKQMFALLCILFAARGSIEVRLTMSLAVLLLSLLCLPEQYRNSQLLNVLRLSIFVALCTMLASDAINVPVQERLPSTEVIEVSSKYKYVLLNLGILKITRRSVRLATAAASLQFTTIQTAVLCLTTSSPEQLTWALMWFLKPLKTLRINIEELALSVLLSFRFLGLIFEEIQNLSKGMLARHLSWKDMNIAARIDIITTLISKTLANLIDKCHQMAKSMMARGYDSSTFKHPHLYDINSK